MTLKSLKHSLLNSLAKWSLQNNSNIRAEKAMAIALDSAIPFVAYSLPGERKIKFFADNPDHKYTNVSETRFNVTTWDGKEVSISCRLSIDDILSLPGQPTRWDTITNPLPPSTSYLSYCNRVNKLIDELKTSGGKVVISRVESYNLIDGMTPQRLASIAVSILHTFINEFAVIFYHPDLGIWISATPELLLSAEIQTGNFRTIALAGTRPVTSAPTPWDDKNIIEHRYVSDYISNQLAVSQTDFIRQDEQTLVTGKIEHIVTRFEGNLNGVSPAVLASSLHPTPAIAGTPIRHALDTIDKIETHKRQCYSGLMSLITPTTYLAYVNLRCLQINSSGVAFYAGGGITSNSEADDEWRETARKLSTLMPFIFPVN